MGHNTFLEILACLQNLWCGLESEKKGKGLVECHSRIVHYSTNNVLK